MTFRYNFWTLIRQSRNKPLRKELASLQKPLSRSRPSKNGAASSAGTPGLNGKILGCLFPMILGTSVGCSELSKLIPASPDPIPDGLRPRDFRSSYAPRELFFDSESNLYGLSRDVQASISRFTELGLTPTQADLESFISIGDSLNQSLFLAGQTGAYGDARSFLDTQPALPSLGEVSSAIAKFENETPNLKSNVAVVLDPSKEAPLVYRNLSQIYVHDPAALEPSAFKLFRAPLPLFSGISTTFDPNLRSAEVAGINQASEALFEGFRALSAESILAYGRSLQPENEFQALLECAQIRLEAPAPEVGSPSANLPERGPWELSLIWPRMLIKEESTSMIDRNVRKPGSLYRSGSTKTSTLTLELRPAAIVAVSSNTDRGDASLPRDRNVILQPAPISIEAKLLRSPNTINLSFSRHSYDGASQSESYSLFHEARNFFHFRFSSAVTYVTAVRFMLSSFQIPYAVRHFEARATRNEDGQWRNALSPSQTAFFQSPSGADGLSTPPEDPWMSISPIQIFRADNSRGQLDLEPETAQGALHYLDPKSLASAFSKTVLNPTSRRKAADSHLSEEEYADLEALCRGYFQGSATD